MSEQHKITLVQKKIINSLLYGKYDVMNYTFARIHTCEVKAEYWLYTGLQGALVYCIKADSKPNTCRFLMFDLKTFEIVFDCELYKKFEKAYKKGSERFYYFEINNGFIGFEIPDMNEAQILYAQVMNFKDDYIKKKLKEYKPLKGNDLQEKAKKMTHKLEKKFKKENITKKMLRAEITLAKGRLEKEINTVQLDDETGNLIIKGTGYQGIERDLIEMDGINLELKNDLKVGNSESFSRYISRNILRSYMKGLIIPKRKINRGEGVKVEKHDIPEDDTMNNNNKEDNNNNEEEEEKKEDIKEEQPPKEEENSKMKSKKNLKKKKKKKNKLNHLPNHQKKKHHQSQQKKNNPQNLKKSLLFKPFLKKLKDLQRLLLRRKNHK